jgi:hypothetical protein
MEDQVVSLILEFCLASILLAIGAWFVTEAFPLQIVGQTVAAQTLGYIGGVLMVGGGAAAAVLAHRVGGVNQTKQSRF